MLTTTPQRGAFLLSQGLPSTVRLGGAPEPVRVLPVPAPLAALLDGGVPRGRVSEVVGSLSTGRTSLILTLLAAATKAHEVTAVVDVPNAFDPISACRAEVDLGAVLWVRPPSLPEGLRCTELILAAGGFGLVVLDLDATPLRRLRLHVWPRLARAAERSGTALVVLAPQRVAGSFAAHSVVLSRRRVVWHQAGGAPVLLDGFESRGQLVRNKLGPPGGPRLLRWGLPTPLLFVPTPSPALREAPSPALPAGEGEGEGSSLFEPFGVAESRVGNAHPSAARCGGQCPPY